MRRYDTPVFGFGAHQPRTGGAHLDKRGVYPYALYLPTPQDQHYQQLEPLINFIGARPEDVFYDFGCGDGRVCIEVARRYGCRSIGIDALKDNTDRAAKLAGEEGLSHLTEFRWENIFEADFSDATVVFMYLLTDVVGKVARVLDRRPGIRVITQSFHPEGALRKSVRKLPVESCRNMPRLIEYRTPLHDPE
jgi:SAM-dependent methyltransferase